MKPECMIAGLEKMVAQGVYVDMKEALDEVFEDRARVNEIHRRGREKLKENAVVRNKVGLTPGGDEIANRWCRWDKPKAKAKEGETKGRKKRQPSQTDELAELYSRILDER